ncbi:hypothetical protein KR009_005392 [Drosophila setifemur]|nr:hypothetical protein KR009_005392 [Drosophila setifemur]
MLVRCLALLLFLALFASLETAPSTSHGADQEQLVRVYEINEDQYKRVLQLANGKNVISEARLINGGFATVSETLSSGWHSLLRIVGLTTLSRTDEAEKIDLDTQPLCVIRAREGESGREEELGKAIESDEEESAIHCIVVLKKDTDSEVPTQNSPPNFAQYWNSPPPPPVEQSPAVKQPQEIELEEEELEVTSSAPIKKKQINKSTYPRAESFENDLDSSRQYGGAYPPPQYGSQYPPSPYGVYPYSLYPNPPPPYGPQPYGPSYGPPPYGQPAYPQPPQFGGQPPIGSPYYPQQYYGPSYPYAPGPYPYYDQSQKNPLTTAIKQPEADEDPEEEEDSNEEDDDAHYGYNENNYLYKKAYNY